MSVSFTEDDQDAMSEKGYAVDKSELGYVYYPKEGIVIRDHITVQYVEYPWITCFQVDGVEIVKQV